MSISDLGIWDFIGLGSLICILCTIFILLKSISSGNSFLYYRFRDLNDNEKSNIDIAREIELKKEQLAKLKDDIARNEELARENEIARQTNAELRGKTSSLIEEINAKLNELSELKLKINESEALKEFIEERKGIEADELDNKIKEKKEELEKLNRNEAMTHVQSAMDSVFQKVDDIVQNRAQEKEESDLRAKIQELSDKKQDLENHLEELNSKIKESEAELVQSTLDRSLEQKIEDLFKLSSLQERIAKKEKELENIRSNKNGAFSDFDSCSKKIINQFASKSYVQAGSENQSLSDFRNYLKDYGIIFNERTINAFHTSLKVQDVNPIAVLAGVSGTGKTLLPTAYAKFFGIYQEHVAVQPRWDSIDDLLGFYNFLENKYKATELVKSLYFFSEEANYSDIDLKNKMLLVLLDEMNLARIEYYFSEFLSKLELRTINRDNAKIIISDKINFSIGSNVLFVGTMNEDESTFALSDKVLDRSNVLHFGAPNSSNLHSKSGVLSSKGFSTEYNLSLSTFANWCNDKKSSSSDIDECIKQIGNINNALKDIGKGFGYRVRNSIKEYILRYPDSVNLKLALADQIEMKIVPKLRGLQVDDDNNIKCLDIISDAIDYTEDDKLIEAFRAARRSEIGMFMWYGVDRGD